MKGSEGFYSVDDTRDGLKVVLDGLALRAWFKECTHHVNGNKSDRAQEPYREGKIRRWRHEKNIARCQTRKKRHGYHSLVSVRSITVPRETVLTTGEALRLTDISFSDW